MFRSIWSGLIRLGQASIPVKACPALDAEESHISLNQVHAECNRRICQKKFCPLHGELRSDEIVTGYQHSPGQYTVLTPAEINQLRSASDGTMDIETFVLAGSIDHVYFSGKSYWLLPNAETAGELYWSFRRAMRDEGVWGLARVVIYRRDHLVVVRPVERLLGMSVLHYADSVRPAMVFNTQLKPAPIAAKGLDQFKSMISSMYSERPPLEDYRDPYHERLVALIEEKIAGQGVSTSAGKSKPTAGNAKAVKSNVATNTRKLAEDVLAAGPQMRPKVPVKRKLG